MSTKSVTGGYTKNSRHSSGAGTDHNMQNSLAPEGKEVLVVIGCCWFRCSAGSCPGEPNEGDKLGELGERENENTALDSLENQDHDKRNPFIAVWSFSMCFRVNYI